MPTTLVNSYSEQLTLQVDSQVNFTKDVSTAGFTRADAAYFGSPSAFLATATVTLQPGVNTLSGANEVVFLAWVAANPASPFLTQKVIFGIVSTPTPSGQTFQVAT